MATRDEHQHSKDSTLLVDDAAGTPLLYRQDTPALTLESILERSRQRCPPGRSPLRDSVWRAANAGAGRLSVTARAIHERATNLGLRLTAAARPAARLPAASRRLQAGLQRPRFRAVGAAAVVLVVLLAVAIGSRLADRTVPYTPEPQNVTTIPVPIPGPMKVGTAGKRSDAASAVGPLSKAVDRPVAATRGTAPSLHTSDSGRRAVSPRLVGALLVHSEPSGAEVLINGVLHGRTPLRLSALPVGSRVIRLDLPGYERWSWAVNIVANKRTPLRVKLQPEHRRRIPGS